MLIRLIRYCMSFMKDQREDTFSERATTLKVMKGGYYWPNLFKDAHS